MLRRFINWLTTPRTTPPDLPQKLRNGLFSTHSDDDINPNDRAKKVAVALASFMENLYALRPKVANVDGATMDSSDGSGLALKAAYQMSQPNLSAAITGYFLSQTFIGHQLAAMFAQHWLIHKACFMPARDAVRNGYTICDAFGDEIKAPKVIKYMELLDKQFRVKKNLIEVIGKARVFGIRIVFFRIESTDPKYYENPFNPDGITPNSYKGMVQVDPYWCAPELDANASSKPDTIHFYEPTWWRINGKRYHRSHLFILREGDVADILKPAYIYGGIPLPQRIVERVYAAERTANEAPQLAMTKRSNFLKTDIAQMIALGQEAFDRLNYQAEITNNYGTKVIGLEDEAIQMDTSLTDFDEVIMTQFQLVCAIAEVPATKMLGTSPKGFGASGDYEISSYHETLESIEEDVSPMVERHHLCLMRSHVVPNIQKIDPNFTIMETSINWKSLDTPTASDLAEINNKDSNTALNYVTAGAVDGYDVRDKLIANKDSGFTGMQKAERPVADEPKEVVPA